MTHKIISQTNNPMLKREDFIISVNSEKNPTKKEIVEMLKSDEGLTIVKKIIGSFGKGSFDVEVMVYDSKEAKDKMETIPRKIKKKLADEAKKASEVKA